MRPELQVFEIAEQQAVLRAACFDLSQAAVHLETSPELLRRSFHPSSPEHFLPPETNSGEPLPGWLAKLPEADRPRLACNALHTNFVRGNGFVVIDGQLICKPPGAIALDGQAYQPLDGDYTALVLSPGPPALCSLRIRRGALLTNPAPRLAISGPALARAGRNYARSIPVRLPGQGQTNGNEINFFPEMTPAGELVRSSFTAFGLTSRQELLVVSVFAGRPERLPGGTVDVTIFHPLSNAGLTLVELGYWMLSLGAAQAILAGGSGDTQQYVQGHGLWAALPYPKPGRVQVDGHDALGHLRGLGAILSIR
ncbi:MAG: hypothetical protein AB1894_22985 [Chloroflexota bacterium]